LARARTFWPAEAGSLAAALAVAALICFALFSAERAAAFAPARPPRAAGLYPVEQFHWREGSFRWTAPTAQLDLPNPGGPLRLSLQLSSGGDRTAETWLGGAVALGLPVGPQPRRYELLVPAQWGERLALELRSPPFRPAGETRELGVELGPLAVEGGRRPPPALLLSVLAATATLYAALRARASRPLAAAAAPLLPAALLAWHAAARWAAEPIGSPLAIGVVGGLIAVLGVYLGALARERPRASGRLWEPAGWALFALAAAGYLGLGLWNHLSVHPRLASDLAIYLEAGRAALSGQNPYLTYGVEELVIGESFIYSPATLPLFATLATLGEAAAERLWLAGSFALYLCALLSIYAALPGPQRRGAFPALLLLGLGFAPVLETLAIGQINSLMLLGLALFLHGHADRRLAWAGDVALAATILVKLTPAVLLLWPLVRRDWPRLLRVGAGAAALCVPALLLYGPEPWYAFGRLLPGLLQGAPRNPYNQALVGLLTTLTPEGSPAEAAVGWAGRAVAPLLLASWALVCWRRRGDAGGAPLAYGVTVLTIASSLVWHHHLTFLALPLAWLGLAGRRGHGGTLALAALGLVQATRAVETGLGMPPWPAAAGYLLLLVALGARLLWPSPGDGRATKR